jgi:hypothetical protein
MLLATACSSASVDILYRVSGQTDIRNEVFGQTDIRKEVFQENNILDGTADIF